MFQIKNEAERAVVYLYGTIGQDFWSPEDSNTAKDFAKTLDDLGGKPVDIHINSIGGDVVDGFAIASAINRYKGKTTSYVDGMAASAASYIALMADHVVMDSFAQIMIHNAWTTVQGNADELTKQAELLRSIDDTIANIISARSGLFVDEVKDAMSAETWYAAQDAIDNGLADEIIETGERKAASLDKTVMQSFKHPQISHEVEKIEPSESKPLLLGNRVY